jgi:GxxExxY protein
MVVLEHQDLTGKIIGAAIEVHKELGPGFLEALYENALCIELRRRRIPFERQISIPVLYRGVEIGLHRLDLLVASEIVVELKAVRRLDEIHFVTVRSYLHALGKDHALLLNFAKSTLEVKRVSVDRFELKAG